MASRLPNSTLVIVLRVLGRERGEEHAEAGGEGEDRAGRHLAVRDPLAERADGEPAADAEHRQAERDRDPDEDGEGRAGKADVRERVRGERVAADHDEVADEPRRDRDERAADESVAHEVRLAATSSQFDW